MYEPNVERIIASLSPNDVVLDIGGWARPFNRADHVMDAEPHETRGYYGPSFPAQGGSVERFTSATWHQRDICEHIPYPFADKSIDFVTCSHTLEDVRDPLWVCSEMVRIAKRGYIEVPSRLAESSRGVEPGQVGWSHHRWLIDIDGDGITFLMKYHMIHSCRRFSFPASFGRGISERDRVQWLFWDGNFQYGERTIHGVGNIARELSDYVKAHRPYSSWVLSLDDAAETLMTSGRRLVAAVERRIRRGTRDRH